MNQMMMMTVDKKKGKKNGNHGKNKLEVCDTIRLLVHMAANIRKLSGLYAEFSG